MDFDTDQRIGGGANGSQVFYNTDAFQSGHEFAPYYGTPPPPPQQNELGDNNVNNTILYDDLRSFGFDEPSQPPPPSPHQQQPLELQHNTGGQDYGTRNGWYLLCAQTCT